MTLGRLAAALSGRYNLERELGQGGMATVYLAEDVRHRRKVAVKVLRPELAATMGADRFLREIEVAANLQHPHILPLFDSGEADGFLFYVMPYIEGESLRGKLARSGELSVAESARILRDVVDALAYAHQQRVVHRDIKPDNVLLSGRHAMVTDFGVAKAVSEATGRQALTTAGVALGTPTYMAPEQAVADPHVDFRADIYAIGVVAYEMLTGSPPFTGLSAQAILAAHVTEPARPITAMRQTVPGPLAQLVMQCLEKRPADRPASAEALLPQLEALATPSGGITPTSTLPLPAVSGAAAAAGRKVPRWALAAGALVVLAGLGYGGVRLLGAGGDGGLTGQSVAVLPFDNVGGDSANASFTDGVHDEILTDLTRVGALQVTSRTSVQEYRNTTKSVKQIGAELGVRTLLEGQVQRSGSQVHVNVQLVDAARDRQLWANSYDRELTAQNIFAIQGDIARSVAQALQVSFSSAEQAVVDKPPTTNLEALDWYHRGQALFGAAGNDTLAPAAFLRAVFLDSSFAEAWAGLASSRSWEVRDGWTSDTTPARQALDRAIALAPSSPETELAQAFYAYYSKGEYDEALTHFKAVAAARPSDVDAIKGIGYIARRQGRFREALQAERRVSILNPRSPGALRDLADSYYLLRQYDRAEEAARRGLILAPSPDDPAAQRLRFDLLIVVVTGQGDTSAGRAILSGASGSGTMFMSWVKWLLDRWAGRYDAGNAAIDSIPPSRPVDRLDALLMKALNQRAAGNTSDALRWADSAARVARDFLTQTSNPDVFGNLADYHTALGLALALQGHATEAVAQGEQAVALNPASRDAVEAPRSRVGLILIQLVLGHREEAVRLITNEAGAPASMNGILPLTRVVLRMDPLFASIRQDPRIQAMLQDDAAWVVKGTEGGP